MHNILKTIGFTAVWIGLLIIVSILTVIVLQFLTLLFGSYLIACIIVLSPCVAIIAAIIHSEVTK